MNQSDINLACRSSRLQKILTRTTYIGLFMNVVAPIGIFALVLALKGKGLENGGGLTLGQNPTLPILFYAFLIVSAMDFVAAFFVRRHLPKRLMLGQSMLAVSSSPSKPTKPMSEQFEKSVMSVSLVIYSLNFSHSAYGLLLALLGASSEVTLFFVALSLISYQLFRPRQKFLENMLNQVAGMNSTPI